MLDEHVGLIYGDSITYDRAGKILAELEAKGFASANVVLGVGSYTYQYVTRDTWGWAVKATYGMVSGFPRNIFKAPKTDDGTKNSAKGLPVVHRKNGVITGFTQEHEWVDFLSPGNALEVVFRNGVLLKEHALSDIRGRLAA